MGEPSSIMHAPYPAAIPAWHDPEIEGRMAAVKDAIHAARSLRAQYGLTPQVRRKRRWIMRHQRRERDRGGWLDGRRKVSCHVCARSTR